MTESAIRKRQSLIRLLLIAGLALPLSGCGHWPLFKEDPAGQPADQELPAIEPEPDAETEPPAEPEPEPASAPTFRPGSGIAVGSAERDNLYATLKEGARALAPGETGYFVDVHEARLRQTLAGTPIHMERTDDRILLTIPGNLSFETDSAKVTKTVEPALGQIAAVLAEFDKTMVSVLGHADDRGDAAYNQALSERRATAVALFLAENGVARERLVGIGHGEERPAQEGDSESARTANRRIEILIEPIVATRDSPNVKWPPGRD